MSRLPLGEVFVQVSKLTKNADKVTFLQKHYTPALGYLLKLAHSDVEWELPADAPPFKKWSGRPGSEPTDLKHEMRRLYIFLKGGAPGLRRIERERKFQTILEGLSTDEVGVLVAAKDKRLDKVYKLTRKVVEEAYPGLLDTPLNLRFGR